jgi:hypothetical protein
MRERERYREREREREREQVDDSTPFSAVGIGQEAA